MKTFTKTQIAVATVLSCAASYAQACPNIEGAYSINLSQVQKSGSPSTNGLSLQSCQYNGDFDSSLAPNLGGMVDAFSAGRISISESLTYLISTSSDQCHYAILSYGDPSYDPRDFTTVKNEFLSNSPQAPNATSSIDLTSYKAGSAGSYSYGGAQGPSSADEGEGVNASTKIQSQIQIRADGSILAYDSSESSGTLLGFIPVSKNNQTACAFQKIQ